MNVGQFLMWICQLPITLGESITKLRLGEHRVVELKGLGVPRRAIQPVLSIMENACMKCRARRGDDSF